jgi:hypothetical protein
LFFYWQKWANQPSCLNKKAGVAKKATPALQRKALIFSTN